MPGSDRCINMLMTASSRRRDCTDRADRLILIIFIRPRVVAAHKEFHHTLSVMSESQCSAWNAALVRLLWLVIHFSSPPHLPHSVTCPLSLLPLFLWAYFFFSSSFFCPFYTSIPPSQPHCSPPLRPRLAVFPAFSPFFSCSLCHQCPLLMDVSFTSHRRNWAGSVSVITVFFSHHWAADAFFSLSSLLSSAVGVAWTKMFPSSACCYSSSTYFINPLPEENLTCIDRFVVFSSGVSLCCHLWHHYCDNARNDRRHISS